MRAETDTSTDGDIDSVTDYTYTYTFDVEGRVTNTHVVIDTATGPPEDHDVEQTWDACGLTSSWTRRSSFESHYLIDWYTDGYRRTELHAGYVLKITDQFQDPATGQPLYDRVEDFEETSYTSSFYEKHYDAYDADHRLLEASALVEVGVYEDPNLFEWTWAFDEEGRETRYLVEIFRGTDLTLSTEWINTWTCP
ncbi:MAG: hypothetical protein H0V89_06230 [Deltaproteobacteria bacterium]|nr:hypothetical protein [Deltaproteobacteria bacterium]